MPTRACEGAYNLTCGANKEGYHHFGFKPDRDLKQLRGIPRSAHGAARATCAAAAARGRTRRSAASRWGRSSSSARSTRARCRACSSTRRGVERPMVMGCYGIGITRTIAAVIEQNYDADGIIWPWPRRAVPRASREPRLGQAGDCRGGQSAGGATSRRPASKCCTTIAMG